MSTTVNQAVEQAVNALAHTLSQVDMRFNRPAWVEYLSLLSERILTDASGSLGTRSTETDLCLGDISHTMSQIDPRFNKAEWLLGLQGLVDAWLAAVATALLDSTTLNASGNALAHSLSQADERFDRTDWLQSLNAWSVALYANFLA